MDSFNHYSEIFKTEYNFKKSDIQSHIEKLKELDKILPPSATFLMITNTKSGQYDFISKNFEHATGLKREAFLNNGIPHFLSLIHPQEIQQWLEILKELVEFYLTEYPAEMLDRLDFQYNYRFRVGEGKYINLLENQVNILADDQGKPMVGMGHFTVFGDGEPLPMRATIRLLDQNNEYQTVFHKVYGTQLLGEMISNRERDILRLIAMGYDNGEIAEKLSISFHTVRTHRKNMLQKTNAKNSTELVVKCMKEGLI